MFPPANNRQPASRLIGALRLIRSFLLLEDDYDVDWEVDRDEPHGDMHVVDGAFADRRTRERQVWSPLDREHPHRRIGRVERRARRSGSVQEREHVCACPLPIRRGSTPANQSRTTAGRPVGGPHV
ncbi:MAG TPA: hypothetical protein VHU13_00800 [Solirubrobacteraceae bacterium]|jgi:hypothetical protein|nr:hypothetical protein [Solirubrobacteraceae bacterium]